MAFLQLNPCDDNRKVGIIGRDAQLGSTILPNCTVASAAVPVDSTDPPSPPLLLVLMMSLVAPAPASSVTAGASDLSVSRRSNALGRRRTAPPCGRWQRLRMG